MYVSLQQVHRLILSSQQSYMSTSQTVWDQDETLLDDHNAHHQAISLENQETAAYQSNHLRLVMCFALTSAADLLHIHHL